MAYYNNLPTFCARSVNLITPADSDHAKAPFRAMSWQVAGDIKIRDLDGNDVVIPSGALAANQIHSIGCLRIWSTGTTATGIIAYT